MFLCVENDPVLFEEYKLTKDELNRCRKRLLAIEPDLCIAEEESPEDLDWEDVFLFVGDKNMIICLIPSFNEINTPSIYVLSNERDYELDDKGVFDFLTQLYEKRPDFRLPNRRPVLDSNAHSLTGLIFHVACFLTNSPEEPESCASYDNYNPRVQPTSKDFDIDEATRLVHIVLTTMYNYPESYNLSAEDFDDLSSFGNEFANSALLRDI